MAKKNIHAVALGRGGGLANTPAQQAARKKAKPGAGRPRKNPLGRELGQQEKR